MGPLDTALLVPLLYEYFDVPVEEIRLDGPVPTGTAEVVLFRIRLLEIVLLVLFAETVVDDRRDDVVEEVVLFDIKILELVEEIKAVDEVLFELIFEADEVCKTVLLLLELMGASLILRAPLMPLFVVALPSLFFM